MKQIVKMMLAAVSSIALATSAYAWDFSASGSSSAKWMTQTSKAGAAVAVTQANFSSSSGGVTVSSSNSDGANSATFSYTADWNGDAGNFDEYVTVSGSKKVGNWTASSSTSQYMQKDVIAGTSNIAGGSKPMSAEGTAAITLTDGSITYKLGDAAHLSTSEKAVNGPMSGAQDAEARVDSFNGFSVGLGVGPGTLTVALDHNAGAATTALGDLSTAVACGGQSTGFGLNFSGNVGVDLSFTYGSGSNAISSTNCTGDNASNAASASTMGLAVGMPMGNIGLALDYESSATSNTAATVETKMAKSGFEISVTMSGIADGTAGINISSQTKTDTVGTADAVDTVSTGTELWWTVPIGPVSLAVGYGASSAKVGEADPNTVTQMGAEMSMSF